MKVKYPTIQALAEVVKYAKSCIDNDCFIDSDDDLPGIQLTIGWNDEESFYTKQYDWSYQTGDNSFSGGAYGYQHWAVVNVYRIDNSRTLAKEIINQLAELSSY